MSGSEFWLSEDQFRRLQPLLPNDTRGVARVDDRRVISGIVHVLRSGCRWVDAPTVYDPRKTLYNRFVRWAAKGVWAEVFQALAAPSIPPKSSRRWKPCFSKALYRGRNAIERMFGCLKDFRRIATRYDRLATNFLAAVQLVATVCYWL
jgi:transposase